MSGIIQVCLSVWIDMFCVCRSVVNLLSAGCVWLLCGVLWVGVVLCVSRLQYITVDAVRLSEPVGR